MIHLLPIRERAAKILAAALIELFPGTRIVATGGTLSGFYGDFIFPFALTAETFRFVEERMTHLLALKQEAKILEMVPNNAAALFSHKKQESLADRAREAEGPLVEVIQLGDYVDLAGEVECAPVEDPLFFKLIRVEEVEGRTRILGTAFASKEELKAAVKEKNLFGKRGHTTFDFYLGGPVWVGKGERVRFALEKKWRELFSGYHLIGDASIREEREIFMRHLRLAKSGKFPLPAAFATCAGLPLLPSAGEGLFSAPWGRCDRFHIFCKKGRFEEELNSSLQLMIKISKLLGFAFRLDVSKSDSSQTLRVADAIGREWAAGSVRVESHGGFDVVIGTCFGSFERAIALMLESGQGVLPGWLERECVIEN
jgi:threonyl-tRNA synthetase